MVFLNKKSYSVNWNILNDIELKECILKEIPELIRVVKKLSKPNGLPNQIKLKEFKNGPFIRPPGSHRAYYWKYGSSNDVIAIKGTEIISPELKQKFKNESREKLNHRPWSKFENLIYREQKAPLAMLFNEAFDEGIIGSNYQKTIFKNFGILEEAPLPLMVIKWNKNIVENYKNTINSLISKRAKDLIFPLIDYHGLGSIVYHYPYLPTRVRFKKSINKTLLKKNLNKKKLNAIQNLIDIQARMLIAGFLPFSFEDHGIGQCIAPQNVTLRGGICDLGSIKDNFKQFSKADLFQLLRSTGTILTRTVFEMLGNSAKDMLYEFENPTPLMHQLSGVIHYRLYNSIIKQAQKFSLNLDPLLKVYFNTDDKSLNVSLLLDE